MSEGFKNLMTEQEHDALKIVSQLAPIIKNKFFSLGRDLVKFEKALAAFGKVENGTPKAPSK